MSDEYTPTTSDIRVAWISNNIDATDESPMPMSRWEAEFDRWLAAHDAEVRADAKVAWDDRDAALQRLGEVVAEAATIRRLHEEATERTVQLAAVIEKARERAGHDMGCAADSHPPRACDCTVRIFSTVDTSAVLRERDAAKWDEGFEACAEWWEIHHWQAVIDEQNPYRPANSEQSPPYSEEAGR